MADRETLQFTADNLSGHLHKLEALRQKYVMPQSRQTALYADEHIAANREAIISVIGAVHQLINMIAEDDGQKPIVESPKLIAPPSSS